MKNKTKISLIAVLVMSFALLPFLAKATTDTPALRSKIQVRPTLTAQQKKGTSTPRVRATTTATSTKSIKLAKGIEEAIKKADSEIEKRIESLNKTLEKISEMKNVSDSEKTSIKSDIQSEITKLEALKSKIDSDTDLATIKKDLSSITSGSRIYALIIPRMNILASVDKVNTIATMLETIATKLESRVNELKASGKDVTAVETALSNISKKIENARSEALTAQTSVSDLVPDNGNKNKLESNNANLKAARESIKVANQNLNDVRKSMSTITKFLKSPEEDFGKTEKVDKNTKASKVKATSTKKK